MAIRFAFITDTHHHPDAGGEVGAGPQMQPWSARIHEALVRDVNDFDPDFVVHGGDIGCGGEAFGLTSEQHVRGLEEAARMLRGIRAPLFAVPGNHDLDPETGSKEPFLRSFGFEGSARRSFVREGVRFVLLDAQDVPRDLIHGHISREQMDWFRRECELARSAREPVVLFCHQVIGIDGYQPLMFVDNSREILDLAARFGGIAAAFHGHGHVNRVRREAGAAWIVTSSLIEYPMMWRAVTVEDGRMRIESRQLDLPDLLAHSSRAQGEELSARCLGRPEDRDLTVPLRS